MKPIYFVQLVLISVLLISCNAGSKPIPSVNSYEINGIKFVEYLNANGDVDLIVGNDKDENIIIAKPRMPGTGSARNCMECLGTYINCKGRCSPVGDIDPGCIATCDADKKNCDANNGCNFSVGTGKGNILY